MDKAIEAAADRVVERRLKGLRDSGSGAGTQRTSGRTTLPKILSDFLYGPEK